MSIKIRIQISLSEREGFRSTDIIELDEARELGDLQSGQENLESILAQLTTAISARVAGAFYDHSLRQVAAVSK